MIERAPYGFGRRMTKCAQFPNAWQYLTPNDIDLSKPCVICFGGNGTMTDSVANGMAKMAENFIDENSNSSQVDIYSIHYGGKLDATIGNLSYDEVEELAKGIFYRRLVDVNGEPLKIDEMMKNMRNVNMFTFCFGANIFKTIINNVAQYMEFSLGLEDEDICNILGQVFHLSYAPSTTQNKFTMNLEVKSLKDKLYDYKSEYSKYFNDNNQYSIAFGENTISLFVKQMADNESIDEHDIAIIKRDENGKTLSKNANVVADTLESVLKFAVNNSKVNNSNRDGFCFMPSLEAMASFVKSKLQDNSNNKKVIENETNRE